MAAARPRGEAFAREVGRRYDAEHRLREAHRDLRRLAVAPTVRRLLSEQIDEAATRLAALEAVFAAIGRRPRRLRSAAAARLVADGLALLEAGDGGRAVRDCLIVGAMARFAHAEAEAARGLLARAGRTGRAEVVEALRVGLDHHERAAARIAAITPELVEKALRPRPTRGRVRS